MQYARTAVGEQRRAANTARSGKQPVQSGQPGGQNQPAPPEPPYDRLVQALVPPPAERDPTLQNLRCASEKALS